MKTLSNEYQENFYEAENNLYIHVWFENTYNFNDELYKEQFALFVEDMAKYHVKYFIQNSQQFKYLIAPDTQLWMAQNMFPKIAATGVEKAAIINSEDFVSGLSVEQTINERSSDLPIEVVYFTSEEEARQWLLK